MKPSKYILSGGGTGGHIFPALAIASEIRSREPDAEILFVGAIGKMEMEKVPQSGFKIKGLWIDGLQRSMSLRNFIFPLKLMVSLAQALVIILRFKPQIVIGTGGFASGSLLMVAQWLKIPTLIQEQNSFPGITNKLLGKKAKAICVAFEGMDKFFPKEKITLTGNPVRKNIKSGMVSSNQAKSFFGLDENKKTLVVLGGSLGARKINELIDQKSKFIKEQGFQVLWQCGRLYYEEYKNRADSQTEVMSFVKDMEQLYAAADIIISRAGAATISELCCVGRPVILIPSPNVAANHQMHNAMALAEKDAAVVIAERNLSDVFESEFATLNQDTEYQVRMSRQLKLLAEFDAEKAIVDLMSLIK